MKMKKFNVLFTALLCASVMFVGCSDDDDNGEGLGNGDSGVIVLPKKVIRVICTLPDYSETSPPVSVYGAKDYMIDTILYAYDAEERLSKITQFGRNGDYVTNIAYTNNKITLIEDNGGSNTSNTEIIELKAGKAIKGVNKYYAGDSGMLLMQPDKTYSYLGNYMSKIIWDYSDSQDESVFSIIDGNLVKMVYDDYIGEDYPSDTTSLEICDIDNNMNIDLMYGKIFDYGDYGAYAATLLCVTGDRFKKLPAKVTYKEEGEEDYICSYAYVVNKDGYVTKITVTEDDEDTTVYDITYE